MEKSQENKREKEKLLLLIETKTISFPCTAVATTTNKEEKNHL